MQRIKKNDKVRVISGSHKNKEGTVKTVFPKQNKVIVEGINKVKRHKKNEDPSKRVTEKELPIDVCKLALIDTKNKKKTMKVSYIFKNQIKIKVNRKTKES